MWTIALSALSPVFIKERMVNLVHRLWFEAQLSLLKQPNQSLGLHKRVKSQHLILLQTPLLSRKWAVFQKKTSMNSRTIFPKNPWYQSFAAVSTFNKQVFLCCVNYSIRPLSSPAPVISKRNPLNGMSNVEP